MGQYTEIPFRYRQIESDVVTPAALFAPATAADTTSVGPHGARPACLAIND
jgi:hypothetical protein